MISKKSNYSILFGLNSEEGYLLLNKDNEVIGALKDNEVIYQCDKYKWRVKKKKCANSNLPKFGIIKEDADGKEISNSILPNRKTILLATDIVAKAKNPFMFYPEGKNSLERFLIKNGIFNACKIIDYNADSTGKNVPFEIFWRTSKEEHYPYAINIYSKDKRIFKNIILELIS